MGSPQSEEGREPDEGPPNRVTIDQPFAVGKYEVTFAEWDACVANGGCRYIPDDSGWGRSDRPVINVSWLDARTYVDWLARESHQSYRLLTEAEWEYVARANTMTRYSWGGDAPTLQKANFGNKIGRTSQVGAYPPNPWGLYDVHGNVREWVQDCWNESYSGAPKDSSAWASGDCSRRVLRGGSWVDGPVSLRSASRYWDSPGGRGSFVGFRVAITLTP